MLIMKRAENVNDQKAIDDHFILWYDKLIKYIAPNDQSVKVIADGFWAKESINRLIEEYAIQKGYSYISLVGLSKDSTNMALGRFKHSGVAIHPSDKGMRMIEQRIWVSIKDNFNKK